MLEIPFFPQSAKKCVGKSRSLSSKLLVCRRSPSALHRHCWAHGLLHPGHWTCVVTLGQKPIVFVVLGLKVSNSRCGSKRWDCSWIVIPMPVLLLNLMLVLKLVFEYHPLTRLQKQQELRLQLLWFFESLPWRILYLLIGHVTTELTNRCLHTPLLKGVR